MATKTFGSPGAPSVETINLDALFSTTMANYKRKLEDNISSSNPLFHRIKGSSAWQSYPGGTHLKIPVLYALQNWDTFKGYDLLPTDPIDGITDAIYEWARVSIPTTISKDEETDNSGEARIVDLLGAKVMQSEMGFIEGMNKMILQGNLLNGGNIYDPYQSPANGSLGLNPLAHLIQTDPTSAAAVGNLDQDSRTWWRNQTEDANGVTTTTGLLQKFMTAINNCSKGPGGKPDLVLCDQTTFEWLQIAIYHRTRHDPGVTANFPFSNFEFNGITFVWDEFVSDPYTNVAHTNTAGVAYLLNTKFFSLKYHPAMNFTTSEFRVPVNQAVKVAHTFFKGQLCISNRRKHGVVFRIPRTFTIS